MGMTYPFRGFNLGRGSLIFAPTGTWRGIHASWVWGENAASIFLFFGFNKRTVGNRVADAGNRTWAKGLINNEVIYGTVRLRYGSYFARDAGMDDLGFFNLSGRAWKRRVSYGNGVECAEMTELG